MADKKHFINPLTRSSERELNVPHPSIGSDVTTLEGIEDFEAGGRQRHSKDRDKVFEATHQRFTAWVDKGLKRQFDELAEQRKVSKSALLDEAIAVLLHKQERKPYTRRTTAD